MAENNVPKEKLQKPKIPNSNQKFMYTAKMHVAYKLKQKSQEIPQDVIDTVKRELTNKDIKVFS